MDKKRFLGYAGRYIRRLPISQRSIHEVTEQKVVYETKDTKAKIRVEEQCTPEEFIDMLSQYIPDRYRHSMLYFGLSAPRTKNQTSPAIFMLLGQQPRTKPPRLPWAASLKKNFGVDPLTDATGCLRKWTRRLPPRSAL